MKVIISLFLFFVSFAGWAQDGEMKLTVTDDVSKECITDSISLTINDSITVKYISQDDCNYRAKNLRPGKYTIKIRSKGYMTLTVSGIVISPGKTAYVNMSLSKDETLGKQKRKKRRKKEK